jgi:propanol-preferring alcohol dehydrogenase
MPAQAERMRAMVFDGTHATLRLDPDRPRPRPGRHEVQIKVHACGVCRTDLHVVDRELPRPKSTLIPGHEIVGTIVEAGPDAKLQPKARVGVPWLGWTCGACRYCLSGRENLCDHARFTGYQIDGGYAEYTVADERFCFAIPDGFTDAEAAPLLCAGLIGYRALRMAWEAETLGLYGFGAAAHIAVQVASVCSPLPNRATRQARTSPATWARCGRADRTQCRPKNWMPR